MCLTKSAILVSSSLVIVALLQLSTNAQEPSDVEKGNAEVHRLQQERVKTLRRAVQLVLVQYREGATDFGRVFKLQIDLLDAELDVFDAREDRMRALTRLLENANRSLATAEDRFQSGQASELDALQAKSAKLRVEIQLVKTRYNIEEKHP